MRVATALDGGEDPLPAVCDQVQQFLFIGHRVCLSLGCSVGGGLRTPAAAAGATKPASGHWPPCHHAVAALGLGAADGDDVEPVGTGLERAHDLGRDAHDVPLAQLEDLVVEQHPAEPATTT